MEGSARTMRHDLPETSRDEQSTMTLLRQLRDEATILFRQEIALAKTEMSEKATWAGRNVAYVAAGALVAYAGAMVLLFGLTALVAWLFILAGMAQWVAAWLAALIVGAIVVGIGYALVQKAIDSFKSEPLIPEKTVETLKEDKQWAQNKVT